MLESQAPGGAEVVVLHLAAELGARGDRGPEHVTGGDVRNPVVGRDPLRLGPLAGPLGAQEQEVHYFKKPS